MNLLRDAVMSIDVLFGSGAKFPVNSIIFLTFYCIKNLIFFMLTLCNFVSTLEAVHGQKYKLGLYESTHCKEPNTLYGIQISLFVVEIFYFRLFGNIRVSMEKTAKIIYVCLNILDFPLYFL